MKSVVSAAFCAALVCANLNSIQAQSGRPHATVAVRGQTPNCAPPPSCAPLPCAPGYVQLESVPSEPETAAQPEGAYVRGPEAGEYAGESTSFGVRGFGLRLPAISIEMPELRMPSLVRYRRNAEMHVESSRSPWVAGRPAEFRQVNRGEAAVVPERGPGKGEPENSPRRENQPYCAPPPVPPCSANEQRLLEELARKEAQLQEMQDRFVQLESVVQQLADPHMDSPGQSSGTLSDTETPDVTLTGYEFGSRRGSGSDEVVGNNLGVPQRSSAARGRMAVTAGKLQSAALQSVGTSGQLSRARR